MKPISYLFILSIISFSNTLYSQSFDDLIITKSKDSIQCKITLINDCSIFYDYKNRRSTKSTYISMEDVTAYLSDAYKDEDILSPYSTYPGCDTCSNWIILITGDTIFHNIKFKYLIEGKFHFNNFLVIDTNSIDEYTFVDLHSAYWNGINYTTFNFSERDNRLLDIKGYATHIHQKSYLGYDIVYGKIPLRDFFYIYTEYYFVPPFTIPVLDNRSGYSMIKDNQAILIPEQEELFLQRIKLYLSDNPELIKRIESKELGYENIEEIFRIYNQQDETIIIKQSE